MILDRILRICFNPIFDDDFKCVRGGNISTTNTFKGL